MQVQGSVGLLYLGWIGFGLDLLFCYEQEQRSDLCSVTTAVIDIGDKWINVEKKRGVAHGLCRGAVTAYEYCTVPIYVHAACCGSDPLVDFSLFPFLFSWLLRGGCVATVRTWYLWYGMV